MPSSDDISVASIPTSDAWAEAALVLLFEAPDLDAASERARTLYVTAGPAERDRLRDGLGALQGAVRWGAAPEDVRLWVAAGLSTDAGLRERAERGAQLGAVRGPDGRLRVPSMEALRAWESDRVELVWVTWSLWAAADDAEWLPAGEEGAGRELEDRREEGWGVHRGGRVGGTGQEVAGRLGLSADRCTPRRVEWTDTISGVATTYVSPTYTSLGGTKPMGLFVVSPINLSVDRSDELPARPDQCLARHEVAAAAEVYNAALVERLDLVGLRVQPEDRAPAPAPRPPPVDVSGLPDPAFFAEEE